VNLRETIRSFQYQGGVLVKVSAAVGADLGLADVAMHSYICSVTGVCTLADKAIHSYICSVTSVCIYCVYKHVAPTFSDNQQSTIDLLFLFNRHNPYSLLVCEEPIHNNEPCGS
jgi:hypothetical protein